MNKTIKPKAGSADPYVVRHSSKKCSYKCRYYLDGPVLSYCNKYEKPLKYDGTIPPLLADECKQALEQEVKGAQTDAV